MINSHIILPKFLLKNFEIDHSFWYYDIDGYYIAKGYASSFNTEKGYYSEEMEQILNSTVETPFSNLLKRYRSSVRDDDEFEMSTDDIQFIKRFFYSLLCRNPQMVEQVKKSSVFFQFLPETDQHDYAAFAGIMEGEQQDLFKEYDATFFVNRTEIPFVLPNCGMYNLNLKNVPAIAFPVSPDIMFALGKAMGEKKGNVVVLPRGLITEAMVIRRMNMQAMKQQISMNSGGRIICSQKEELERLKANRDNGKDETK